MTFQILLKDILMNDFLKIKTIYGIPEIYEGDSLGKVIFKAIEDCKFKINEGVRIVDIDVVGDRVFALCDDMPLIEISIKFIIPIYCRSLIKS